MDDAMTTANIAKKIYVYIYCLVWKVFGYLFFNLPSLILDTNDCHATNWIENTTEFSHKNW